MLSELSEQTLRTTIGVDSEDLKSSHVHHSNQTGHSAVFRGLQCRDMLQVMSKRINLTAWQKGGMRQLMHAPPKADNLRRQGQQSRGPPMMQKLQTVLSKSTSDAPHVQVPSPSRSPLNTDRREEAQHHINGHHVGRPPPSCRRCWQGERHSLLAARCHPLLDCRRRNRKSSVLGDS